MKETLWKLNDVGDTEEWEVVRRERSLITVQRDESYYTWDEHSFEQWDRWFKTKFECDSARAQFLKVRDVFGMFCLLNNMGDSPESLKAACALYKVADRRELCEYLSNGGYV